MHLLGHLVRSSLLASASLAWLGAALWLRWESDDVNAAMALVVALALAIPILRACGWWGRYWLNPRQRMLRWDASPTATVFLLLLVSLIWLGVFVGASRSDLHMALPVAALLALTQARSGAWLVDATRLEVVRERFLMSRRTSFAHARLRVEHHSLRSRSGTTVSYWVVAKRRGEEGVIALTPSLSTEASARDALGKIQTMTDLALSGAPGPSRASSLAGALQPK